MNNLQAAFVVVCFNKSERRTKALLYPIPTEFLAGTLGAVESLFDFVQDVVFAEMTCKGLFSPSFTHTRPHFPKLYSVNILYRDRHPDGLTLNK